MEEALGADLPGHHPREVTERERDLALLASRWLGVKREFVHNSDGRLHFFCWQQRSHQSLRAKPPIKTNREMV